MAVIDRGQVYRWVVTRCVHTTHVPWATGELTWVWLLCSPERLALAHTHRNMRLKSARPDSACKWRHAAMVYSATLHLPRFKSASHASRAPHAGWERGHEASWARLSSRSKTASDAAADLQSISPPMPTTGNGLSFCTVRLCFLLPLRYTNTIQPLRGSRESPGIK